MHPIPYEAVAGSDPGSIILKIVVGLLVMTAGVLFASAAARKRKHEDKTFAVDDLIGIAAVLLGFFLIVGGLAPVLSPALHTTPDHSQTYKQTEAVQKEIQKSYGMKLSFKEAGELEYPTEAPKTKFKVYGSFDEQKQVEGKAFKSRTVYLVWSDGSLGLSESSDGKSFTPLEPRA